MGDKLLSIVTSSSAGAHNPNPRTNLRNTHHQDPGKEQVLSLVGRYQWLQQQSHHQVSLNLAVFDDRSQKFILHILFLRCSPTIQTINYTNS